MWCERVGLDIGLERMNVTRVKVTKFIRDVFKNENIIILQNENNHVSMLIVTNLS